MDTFTVLYPKSQQAYPLTNYSFDILHGLIPQYSADLYVSPQGSNLNSGLTPEDPMKTISFALSIIAEDSLSLYSVKLLDGTYSVSTNGELFPLSFPEHVGLTGT